jgi:hypothetical protein
MTIKDKIKRIKERRGGLRLTSKTIQSDTSCITRAVWTREMSFELNSFHGIDEIVEMEQILINELNNPSN